MRRALSSWTAVVCTQLVVLSACVGAGPSNDVTFVDRPAAFGSTPSSGGTGGSGVAVQQVTGGMAPVAGTGGMAPVTGTGGMAPVTGTGGLPPAVTGGVQPVTGGVQPVTGGVPPVMSGGAVTSGGVVTSGGTMATGGMPAVTRNVTVADFSVTTTSPGGRYSPKNVGAIWVENSSGQWVKTLEHWAGTRGRYLSKYNAANPLNNVVDAITSATLSSHRTHNVSWNLKDSSGADVPDGTYNIVMEITDQNSSGPSNSASFMLGADPVMQSFPDASNFKSMSLNVH